jgi:hypothetical protein
MSTFDPLRKPEEPLPGCNPEIFLKGEVICMFHAAAKAVEPWVKQVAAESGQRVDWHYMCGYACVRYLGDGGKVLEAVMKLKPALEEACAAIGHKPEHFQICNPPFAGGQRMSTRKMLNSELAAGAAPAVATGRVVANLLAAEEANTLLPDGLIGVLFDDDRGFVGENCLTDADDIDDEGKCTPVFDYDTWFTGDVCTRCQNLMSPRKR